MKIRRVVAAVGADGKSRFIEDDLAPCSAEFTSAPGYAAALVWATESDDFLSRGKNGTDITRSVGFVPKEGESRLMIATFPPDSWMMRADFDAVAFGSEFAQKLPGFAETFEPEHPGMHTTDSVDYDVVLEGELTLELDDGQEVLLRKHDVAVQYGTRHAWRNRSEQPATILFVLLGAKRAP